MTMLLSLIYNIYCSVPELRQMCIFVEVICILQGGPKTRQFLEICMTPVYDDVKKAVHRSNCSFFIWS